MSVFYLTNKAIVLDATVPESAHNSSTFLHPFLTPSL